MVSILSQVVSFLVLGGCFDGDGSFSSACEKDTCSAFGTFLGHTTLTCRTYNTPPWYNSDMQQTGLDDNGFILSEVSQDKILPDPNTRVLLTRALLRSR